MTNQAPASLLTKRLLALLAAIGALGSMAIHMIVPSVPGISASLNTTPEIGQLAISGYLIALGIGQFIGGAISDRYGRRPVLLAGVFLFVVGSVGGAVLDTTVAFLASRLIQALGGGAAIVVARVIIADLSSSEEMASKVAGFTTILLMSPALAPFIGGLIESGFGWHAIFWMLGLVGLITGILVWRYFTESMTQTAHKTDENTYLTAFGKISKSIIFWRYALAISFASSAMYLFLGGSSFLLIDKYGLTPPEAGFCYLIVAACGISGTLVVGRLEKTIGAFRTGLTLATTGSGLMLMAALAGFDSVLALMMPMCLVGVGAGLAAPSGFAGILRSVKGLAGTASSLAGAIQMLGTGIATSIVTYLLAGTFAPLAAAIFAASLGGLLLSPKGPIAHHKQD